MNKKNNIQNTLKGLPQHKPVPDLWNSIEARLDVEQNLYRPLAEKLPVRKPKNRVWNNIERQLNKNHSKKQFAKIKHLNEKNIFTPYKIKTKNKKPLLYISSVATMLLLLLGIYQLFDKPIEHIKKTELATLKPAQNIKPTINPAATKKLATKKRKSDTHTSVALNTDALKNNTPENEKAREKNISANALSRQAETLLAECKPLPTTLSVSNSLLSNSLSNKPANDITTENRLTFANEKTGNNALAIAINWGMQSFDNNLNTTNFRNISLTLNYKKGNFGLNSSLGYAYAFESNTTALNNEQPSREESLSLRYPPTVIVGNRTVINSYDASTVYSDLNTYSEMEKFNNLLANPYKPKHPFLLYDIGASLKITEGKNLSAWLKTTTAIAIKLNGTSKKETDIKEINATLNENKSLYLLPYNKYKNFNLNISTGIQIDYKLLNKISIYI